MTRKELESKVIDIVSKYTFVITTIDSNIYDDLGIDSLDRESIEEEIKDEIGIELHWSTWDRFWHTKPTVADLIDFIEREL
jgi:acyl carrier protein